MGEPLFAPIKTTDDDDDEEKLAGDGGPTATRFRDDQKAGTDDKSVFDWDKGDGRGESNKKADKKKKKSANAKDIYEIDFDADASDFSPVSLRDDDEEDGVRGDDANNEGIRRKANKLINKRIDDDTTYDDEDRIFVGGGWGRHGSQFSCCPKGLCGCCSGGGGGHQPSYSRGPPQNKCALVRTSCALVAFFVLVLGAGLFGYEAGLPVEEDAGDGNGTSVERGEGSSMIHYHGTRGEEWVEWLERESREIHLPHWNFTVHHKADPAFKAPVFAPQTQAQLLTLSENVFQSCSERSLLTTTGHDACLSFCHGHYCCFEKDPDFGSCVGERNSYCFAYAACENILGDFEMNNVAQGLQAADPAAGPRKGNNEPLDKLDVQLLDDTCAYENIATPEGLRDCTAFCKHNLCCFEEWEGDSCREDNVGYCEAYASCFIMVDVLKEEVVDGIDDEVESGGDAGDETPSVNGPVNTNANDGIETAVKAVCGLADLTACYALCADHLCCFSADGTKGSCRDTYGEDMCNAYQACTVLNR